MERYQRHKHPLGDSTTDGDCHRHDNSHCPAGHTEQGRHGSQNCRKDDAVDSIFTRIQYMLKQGGKAALEAIVETLKNEAADQLNGLNIDWDEFATDSAEQQKLLDLLNPMLQQNNIEVYTLNDLQTLWSDIGERGRRAAAGGGSGAACYIAVEAVLVKATKGKSLKPANRHAVGLFLATACGIAAAEVPVPDPDDDSSDDDGRSNTPRETPPSDTTPTTIAPPTTTTVPPPTTAPPFDPAGCHTWFELTRTCVKIDEKDGMATITRH